MFRPVFLASLAMLAVPAFAQDVAPEIEEATAPGAAPAGDAAPPEARPTMPDEVAPAPEARPATGDEVGRLVAGEFPQRDLDSDGALSEQEFSSWLGELMARSPSGSASGDPAQISAAFSQSDADGSGSVSPAEMIALLSRGR